ncbi:Phosphodiesterase/alkaline phosphatase D (modular protein) [Candidatus Promineifilum breve]|uniref:Phosphodiesterase/alkaline phosphatase D (Modular protein) n=1 Tax=Candidatus Promineifilum breve TaxID=1806508 RepID=A0A160T0V7_9CHLR|nr:metallophosphoesterase [Candidatus Promineifilum breve]CUS03601.2 Phosphodiesterase/alkaline phosphatase D (modular protein) [Candidatus Promineifilum breve]
MKSRSVAAVLLIALLAWPLVNQWAKQARTTPLVPLTPVPQPADTLYRFAVIGDYGDNSAGEAAVAALVAGWNPDFVITTGDNNYPNGGAATIDRNIGQFYSAFIGNYHGQYGLGSPTNRFWPSLGNHDWHSIGCGAAGCNGPYFDYFTLPGNERYYQVDYGPLRLYALDSAGTEPDGETFDSVQGNWLQGALAASDACYDVVYFHHPPYSSGKHGSNEKMRWPFAAWGADVVLSGHEHSYERLDVAGMPYFVNGIGGKSKYPFSHIGDLPEGVTSVVRYNENYGAMLVTLSQTGIVAQLFDADGNLIDQYTQAKDCGGATTPTATPTPTPSPTPTATPTITSTSTPTATGTPTASPTTTSTPTASPTPTITTTPTATPTGTLTITATPTMTATTTPTPTMPPVSTATATATGTVEPTPAFRWSLFLPGVVSD